MKIKHGIADWILEVISFLLLAGASLYLLIGWNSFPDKLPMHHNFAGEIDRWGDKSELLFLVVVAWVLYVLLVAVERFPQIWNTGVQVTPENRERVYRALKYMLGTMKVLVNGVFAFLIVQTTFGQALPGWFLPVFLAVFLGDLVFWLVRLYRIR